MRSIESSSPRKANGAIIAPVLTPVTTSKCGRAMSPFTRPQPFSTPAPNAPQSPPPEMMSKSSVPFDSARLRNGCMRALKPSLRAASIVLRAAINWSPARSGRGGVEQPTVSSAASRRVFFMGLSEAEGGAQRGAAEAEIVDQLAVVLVVAQRAVGEHQAAPLEGVADPREPLPRESRGAGTGVEVVRQEPRAAFLPPQPAAHADQRVPDVGAPGNAAGRRKSLGAA